MEQKIAKHTPGPWAVSDDGLFVGADMVVICNNPGNEEDYPYSAKAWPANARLIAAAPDLLAHAQECLPYQDEHTRPYRDWDRADLIEALEAIEKSARAAIAKAEGR